MPQVPAASGSANKKNAAENIRRHLTYIKSKHQKPVNLVVELLPLNRRHRLDLLDAKTAIRLTCGNAENLISNLSFLNMFLNN